MFKIIFEDLFEEHILNFIESYKRTYEKLYFDTGLFGLDIIIQSYINKGNLLEKEIRDEIEKTLQEEIIGYRLYENGEKSVKIFLKSFMLEVYFEEDDDEKIRFVEKIIINKK